MDTLRFAIGDEDENDLFLLRNILQSNGYTIACEETDGPALLRQIRILTPDFVITSFDMPGIGGSEIARIVQGDRIAPVLIVAESSQDIFARNMGNESFPYILKPVSEMHLLSAIEYIYNSFKKLSDLEREVAELKKTLEDRKAVDRAKGILMDRYNMKEKDAFRYIQKRSMDECKPIAEIAKRIIDKTK
ncbi:MAG TPA: response regulator [Clostridiaceae bacterium]|nr:response regulator [Clostridiaceae bacterium]